MDDDKQDVASQNVEDRKEFIDPVTTPIAFFVLKQICAAIISFFTFQAIQAWWNRCWKKDEETNLDQDA